MNPWYLVLVALVQGLTEFLPVSSSAHLILLPRLLEVRDQGLLFDVAANTGTLLAASLYFHAELRRLGAAVAGFLRGEQGESQEDRRLVLQIAVASVPVLAAGWLLRDQIATLARDPILIACTSIGFGLLLGFADRWGRKEQSRRALGLRQALFIGLLQALALLPGTSRSGITITAGLLVHLRRDEAAHFAFLLALPASAGAAASELIQLAGSPVTSTLVAQLALVALISALAGLVVIHLLIAFLRRRGVGIFVVYRVLLGILILLSLAR